MEGYLGQVYRSKSKVKGSGHQVKNILRYFCLMQKAGTAVGRNKPDEAVQRGRCKISITSYTKGGPKTQGVFKVYAYFFV